MREQRKFQVEVIENCSGRPRYRVRNEIVWGAGVEVTAVAEGKWGSVIVATVAVGGC